MVRTAGLLSLLRRLLRFTTPGRPGAVAACYVALWRLPRPDFHRLVIRTFKAHQRLVMRLLVLVLYEPPRTLPNRDTCWFSNGHCEENAFARNYEVNHIGSANKIE